MFLESVSLWLAVLKTLLRLGIFMQVQLLTAANLGTFVGSQDLSSPNDPLAHERSFNDIVAGYTLARRYIEASRIQ